jgi:hypothetical protein
MPALLAALVVVACGDVIESELTFGEGDREVSGTVFLPAEYASATVRIGDFTTYFYRTGDVIDRADYGDGPPNAAGRAVISLTGSGTARTYTYQLPASPEDFGALVAWVDLNGNGTFEPGSELESEPGRYPRKTIEGSLRFIVGWGQFGEEYMVNDGLGNNWGLSITGTDGFDFDFR